MALTKSLSRIDAPTLQTHDEGAEREPLLALSQRKLNALGMPVCYIDADQHYRFANRAFLDWTGKSAGETSAARLSRSRAVSSISSITPTSKRRWQASG